MPVFLYGREAWCLKESEMGILQRTVRFMMRTICDVNLKDEKSKDLMLMLGLNGTID